MIFIILFLALYILLILFLIYGWLILKPFKSNKQPISVFLSVIIPARNEENNIGSCLNHVLKQNYPVNLIEIIVVDDNSTDNTVSEVLGIQQQFPNRVIKLITNGAETHNSKKKSIAQAVSVANGELIITTDADCSMKENWLSTIASFYLENNSKFISAPVNFHNEDSIFKTWQSLEFLSLIGVGAASIKLKMPLMCNGANLAFEKKVFEEVGEYGGSEHIASGDDTFLMFKIVEKYPDKVHFLKAKEATVYTEAKGSLKEFYQQRKRWASKTHKYDKPYVILVGLIVYGINFLLISGILLGISNIEWLRFSIICSLIKMIPDFIFLLFVSKFFNKSYLLKSYISLQLIYPFYIVLVATLAPFGKYKWKERLTQ